jgi:pre-mRNA-splicing factor SPF27
LEEDWKRVEKTQGQGFTTPFKFPSIEQPSASASFHEWEEAVQRARINYEYVKNQLELLELQHQFGANSWLEFNKSAEKLRDQLKSLLEGYKSKMEQINIQRKASQLQAKTKLATLESQWLETTRKNAAIEQACLQLEADLGH